MAVEYLERTLKALSQKGGYETSAVLVNAPPDQIHQRIGYAYLQLQKPNEALHHFRTACELNPQVDCYRRLADIYFRQASWDECIQALQQVLRFQKDDPDIYGMMGVAFSQKGDTPTAIAVFREGIKNVPNKKIAVNYHNNIGHLFLQNQRIDDALKEFQTAVSKDWNNAESHFGLALAYLAMNRLTDAQQSLQNVLRVNPSHEKAKQLLARTRAAQAVKI